jgi:hypothetical protein
MIRSRTLSSIDYMNPALVRLLHFPVLHWLASPGLMTISLRGRRSGKPFRFPVGYHDQTDAIVVLISNAKGRQWWRNFESPWPATLRIRGSARDMIGEVLEPGSREFASRVSAFFARAAFIPRMFGVGFDPATGLDHEQTKALGETAAVVRFRAADSLDHDDDWKIR